MKYPWLALASASVCVSAPALAQTAPAPGKSVQLSRVVFDTETNPIEARVKGGTLCVFPSNIELPKEKKTQDLERFDSLFSGEMQRRGFTVVSSAGDMFASESEKKGDYLVGATVQPEVMNICSSVAGYKGTIAVKVQWQIFDRATQTVVERAETSGEGTVAKFSVNGLDEMFNLAFTSALTALAEQHPFEKYVPVSATAQPAAAAPAAAE